MPLGIRKEVRRTAPFCIAIATRSATHAGRFRLHPIQSFETGLKFVDWLNRAIGPFGLYFPILAIFKNHTKYRSRHVFTCPHFTCPHDGPARIAQHFLG